MKKSHQVAIITNQLAWHSNSLKKSFAKRGYEVKVFALPDCEFSTEKGGNSIILPGFDNKLPEAVFVRCIPQGSFEQIIYYLNILYTLQELGVIVYNDAPAIERSVDKLRATILLKKAGLPVPDTWSMVDVEKAKITISKHIAKGKRLVMKPIFGAQGKGLQLITKEHPDPDFHPDSVYYLQDFIDTASDGCWSDWRLFVIGGQVVATMKRFNSHWVSNIASGAQCYAREADHNMTVLAQQASQIIGTIYAGVDIIQDRKGNYWITEVNSIPAWKGLQSVTNTNIAGKLVDNLLFHIRQKH